MYIFDKIIACSVDNFDKINKNTKYKILVNDRVYTVASHQIRNEVMNISEAEKQYWFSELYDDD